VSAAYIGLVLFTGRVRVGLNFLWADRELEPRFFYFTVACLLAGEAAIIGEALFSR
jgi:hypothetical protein